MRKFYAVLSLLLGERLKLKMEGENEGLIWLALSCYSIAIK
ncbi:hypothetical protein CEV32_1716 [Brucella rhizosphaerae]|uniref:Uncharacterized protein n=1 Tax=Brucella rhizosphaerae TaxID=571254 RepID=A0A256F350_9HYPH|nr:hypothetical protein CEV32_1716 [Brucella rhizosphaerae]